MKRDKGNNKMSKKHRICIFSAQYLPHMGGLERHTHNLAKKLAESGCEVTIVTSNVVNAAVYEHSKRMRVYRMPCFNWMDGRFPVPKPNRLFCKIHRVLSAKEFDLIIVSTRFYFLSLYGMCYAKRKGIKCIAIEHGTGHLATGNRFFDVVGEVYEHLLTGVERRICTDYYGVSNAAVNWLTHFHIRAKGVLYNSVDLEQIEKLYEDPVRDFRKDYRIPEDVVVVAYTGRLIKEKGVLSLICAVKELHKRYERIFLFIAGEGELRNEIEEQEEEYIVLLGKLEFEQVISLLRQTDIFCLPSAYPEGFPTSTLEAMSCRCYPLVTDRGGAQELISDSSYGKILSDNRPETLVKAIGQIMSDRDKMREVSAKGYQRVKDFFTWNRVTGQIIDICGKKTS
jgi:glycosyltransferase involved in cell wall biosynthesis